MPPPSLPSVRVRVGRTRREQRPAPAPDEKDGIAVLLSSYGDKGAISSATAPVRSTGFVALSPDPDDAEQAVMGVWLLRSARRKGVGRELALMATDFARGAGYQKLRGTLPEGDE